ncbi:MAG: Peptidoglycan glycosyltransferase [Ignavibacteria bacterium]|nr:Peptidoglycan glycosyltransferase [Ignavibacteria bacterium]
MLKNMADKEEEQEDSEEESEKAIKSKNRKLVFMLILFFIGFLVIGIRLFGIQILNSAEYKEKARRQHESRVALLAERGSIYDRNGKLLASNVRKFSIAVDPVLLEEIEENNEKSDSRDKISEVICRETGMTLQQLNAKIDGANGSFLWLARGLPISKLRIFQSLKNKALLLIPEPKRNLIYSNIAAQILGATDIDNNGISGIEKYWNKYLQGKDGFMTMHRDALGRLRPAADLPSVQAENGNSLQLTLDIDLQQIAEYELKQGVISTGSVSGTVIAMKPSTGEILAIASYPGYSPENTSSSAEAVMRNRAFTDLYEPGSTFKLITAAAALEERIFSPSDVLDGCDGVLAIDDYKITDVHGVGKITFRQAFEISSNIIFSTVASRLPDYKFYKYIRNFGFGLTLGIDAPGEVPGRIPKMEEITPVMKRFLGFGYGFLATGLQVVGAYATVANGGKLMKPYILASATNDAGENIYTGSPEMIRHVITKGTAQTLTNLLTGVVNRGTGLTARIDGFSVAGKTGTTKLVVNGVYSEEYIASFAGYFPAENPTVAMLVLLEKPKGNYYAAATAAPVFKSIATRWLNFSPESALGEKYSKQKSVPADSSLTPSVCGMTAEEAYKEARNCNLMLTNEQRKGVIVYQNPASGTTSKKGTYIDVHYSINEDGKPIVKTPSVKGLSLRRALRIMHSCGIKANVTGTGTVAEQVWSKNARNELFCKLICR